MSWSSWSRSRRRSVAVLVLAAAGLTAIGVDAADDDGLVYYRTPSEAAGAPAGAVTGAGGGSATVSEAGAGAAAGSELVRVGGLVVPGSVDETADGATLLLTDGATDVEVTYDGRLPPTVREGEGAVVEGRYDDAGVLVAERLLMRHSNEYEAAQR
ncbi:hypothetical protein GCM10023169_35640 [Georgenia halophila]|uniref:Cytochrome c-type biogenesis protein CcmE n=1 Tax=Georgenia halophila TaxID=620889 RepID=A0ABP8LK59_9MICO